MERTEKKYFHNGELLIKTAVLLLLTQVLLLFSVFSSQAQSKYNFFYGKIREQGNNTPITEANLVIENTKTGSTSGKTGEFSFFTDSIPVFLRISHVGYKTKRILLDNTSFSLDIYLEPETRLLEEVEIKATETLPFFRSNSYSVRDYEIDSSRIFLLVYKLRVANSELICLNQTGDTLATSGILPFAPVRLFRDCLGFVHVLGRDSCYQVYVQGPRLRMIHAVSIRKFEEVLKDCVLSTPETFYFKRTKDKGMAVEYYGVDKKTLARNFNVKVNDDKKLRMIRRNSDDARLFLLDSQPESREDFVTWNYIHKILFRPIRTEMIKLGSYICIFNVPDKQIEFYDMNGTYSCKIAIHADTLRNGRWGQDILVDLSAEKAYTTLIKNGKYTICRIDLNTGMLIRRTTLEHPFPQKIKISAGVIYYLYDVPGQPDNKMMFIQKF